MTDGPGPGSRRSVLSAAVTFGSFALPAAMLGVLWPDVQAEFGQSLGALGIVALTYGLSRMAPATTGRPLARRFGLALAFTVTLAALALACLALASATSWPMFLVGVAAIGLASGTLDSLGATFITTHERVGSAGLIHGAYGIGATVGPLAVAILAGWRRSIVACMVVAGVALALAWWARASWPMVGADDADRSGGGPPVPVAVVALSLVTFAAFVAVEVTTGQWAYIWLTDQQGVAAGPAAAAVSAFWGGTTIGRLALARPSVSAAVSRFGLAPFALGAVAGLAILAWWPAIPPILALGLVGLALAPVVPTMFATTADRVGRVHATRVAGWQLLATNVGAISMPALTGVLVDRTGPGVILTVVTSTLVLVCLPSMVLLRRLPTPPAPRPAPSTPGT